MEVTAGTGTTKPVCGPVWARQYGTSASDWAYAVSVDASGNVYVVGMTPSALIGENFGGDDAYVRKYDSAGTVQWTRQFGTEEDEKADAVSVDASGNVYVAGETSGALSGASFGNIDAYVRKYNSAGTEQWTRQFGSWGNDGAWAVAVDASGSVYVAGRTQGGLSVANVGGLDAYVRKYDSAGIEQWTAQLGSAETDWALGVSVDAGGNVYVAGNTEGAFSGENAGGRDAFVGKVDSAGTELWRRQFGTEEHDDAYGVAVDASGNAYVVGGTQGALTGANEGDEDAFMRKYDSAGTELWTRQFGTYDTDHARSVSIAPNGAVYVAGGTFGPWTEVSANGDAFVSKYDGAGTEQWTRQFGSEHLDAASSVSVDTSGSPYIAGYTHGDLSGASAGLVDAFVAKLTP